MDQDDTWIFTENVTRTTVKIEKTQTSMAKAEELESKHKSFVEKGVCRIQLSWPGLVPNFFLTVNGTKVGNKLMIPADETEVSPALRAIQTRRNREMIITSRFSN